jgi:hypothetical protein
MRVFIHWLWPVYWLMMSTVCSIAMWLNTKTGRRVAWGVLLIGYLALFLVSIATIIHFGDHFGVREGLR